MSLKFHWYQDFIYINKNIATGRLYGGDKVQQAFTNLSTKVVESLLNYNVFLVKFTGLFTVTFDLGC